MNKIKQFIQFLGRMIASSWHWYKSLYIGRAWYTKTAVAFTSLVVFFFLYLGAVDVNFLWLFGKSPGFFDIKQPQTHEASEIYSADGQMIGKYFNENRTPVEYDKVNRDFWRALIDTEDERFYKHWGIDPIGLFGAVKDAATGRGGRGASTITQQLAKNLFRMRTSYSTGLLGHIPGVKMLIMKSKEWILAVKLEICYSKEEIITMYANTVDFGSNAYGIKTAAKTYFNTTPDSLRTEEAAVLVGMLKATTMYNPISNPENSKKRRNQVLENMYTHNDLTSTQRDSLKKTDIKLHYSVESNYDGQALYFRDYITKYLKDWCEENQIDLYNDGLKIYTTIDTRMQKYAEAAAAKKMKEIQSNFDSHWSINRKQGTFGQHPWQDENQQEIEGFIEDIAKKQPYFKALQSRFPDKPDSIRYYLNLPHKVKVFDYEKGEIEKEMSTMDSIRYMVSFMHCSMIAMEPKTGAVKAWVGDIDFDHWKYDKVSAERQPGSTFKLFVYTEAMNQGLTPCDKRRDEYISMQVYDKKKHMDVTWTPGNANGHFSGDSMALKSAFAQSINSVAVRLGQEMGIKHIIQTAHDMGIKSPLDDEPSLALGSSDVTLLEMTDAYCTIADNGRQHEPVLITRIEDHNGEEIYTGPTEAKQVIPYKSAFLMQKMLMGGLREPGGTSQSLNGYVGDFRDTEFGGKTGTSNNHSDAWFMAVSPNLVVGSWVGGEYRCIHFRTGALGQGSRTALPICGYFLQSLLSDPTFKQYHGKFDRPNDPDITSSMYECESYYEQRRDTTNYNDSTLIDGIDGDPLLPEDDELDQPITPEQSTEPKELQNVGLNDL